MNKRTEATQTLSPLISAILPCYNVEEYLQQAVESLQRQTFKDFEIILINDGGSPKQRDLILHLQSLYSNIRIIDQPNRGVSAARNAGLDIARGKWIVFIDPDDSLLPSYLETLYDAAVALEADIAIGGFFQYFEKEQRMEDCPIEETEPRLYSCAEVFDLLKYHYLHYCVLWNKIFSADFLRRYDCRFCEGVSRFQDQFFIDHIILHTPARFALVADCGYVYHRLDNRSASSKYHPRFTEIALQLIKLMKEKIKLSQWNETDKDNFLNNYIYRMGYSICWNFFKRDSPLTFVQRMKAIDRDILHNPEIMHATLHCKRDESNFYMKIYDCSVATRSKFFIVATHTLLFAAKYRFYSLYLKLLPFLRQERAEH